MSARTGRDSKPSNSTSSMKNVHLQSPRREFGILGKQLLNAARTDQSVPKTPGIPAELVKARFPGLRGRSRRPPELPACRNRSGAPKSQPDPAGRRLGLLQGVAFLKKNQNPGRSAGRSRTYGESSGLESWDSPRWGHIPEKGRSGRPGPERSGRERRVGPARLDLPEEREEEEEGEEEEEEEEERCRPLPGGSPEFQESGDPRGASKARPNGNVFLLRGEITGRESGDPNSREKGIDRSKFPQSPGKPGRGRGEKGGRSGKRRKKRRRRRKKSVKERGKRGILAEFSSFPAAGSFL